MRRDGLGRQRDQGDPDPESVLRVLTAVGPKADCPHQTLPAD